MNAHLNVNQSSETNLCPSCKRTRTIDHNGRQWCPNCAAFVGVEELAESASKPCALVGATADDIQLLHKAVIAEPASKPHAPIGATADEIHLFHEATQKSDLKTVKALLNVHPDLVFSIADNKGTTPLHRAASSGHKDVAHLLLASHAEVNVKDKDGWTPLHSASFYGCTDVSALLLANNALIDPKDNHGQTPLRLAAARGHKAVVLLLLASHADANAMDDSGLSPLDAAVANGRQEVAALLLIDRANVNPENNKTNIGKMETGSSKVLRKEQKPPRAGAGEAVPQQVDVQTEMPPNAALTVVASTPSEPDTIHAAEAQVAAEWHVGDVILDLYEVKQVHGGGGMGLVYRVHHRGWNTDLAVKSPRSDYFRTETQKENFTRECETWINLGLHPHVVSCHYVRTLGGVPRVFAEYVEGGTLKEWIESRKLYEGGEHESLKRVLDVPIQMAWGLHYAHEQGLIHQDVKPANVMMMPDGTAKIADFGLAKARALSGDAVVAETARSILVSSGGMTPAYCSPEQANNQKLSRKTDIWSWAVSVLEMFTGEVCWRSGAAAPEALKRLRELRVERVGIPEPSAEFQELLERCFATELSGRPETFRVVAETLKAIYHTLAGEEYNRELLQAANIQADALNNRAVSMLDLGRSIEAEKLFDQALAMDPGHPQATYNRGLHLWHNGCGTDSAIVEALKQSHLSRPGDGNVLHLLGLLHLERRDAEGALAALSAAETLIGGAEIQQALAEARCIETYSPKCLRTFKGHTFMVNSVALSTDGHWALSGSKDNTLRVWDVTSGKCLRTLGGHTEYVNAVALSGDGRRALSGSSDRTLRLWEVSGLLDNRKILSAPLAVCRSAVTTEIMAAQRRFRDRLNAAAEALSQSKFALARSLAAESRALPGCQFSEDALDMAHKAGLRGKRTKLRIGWCRRTLEGHTGELTSVALSADNHWAASGSWEEKTLRIWEVSSGTCSRILEGHTKGVYSVALSGDGRRALSGSMDTTLRLWEVSSGRCLKIYKGHTNIVYSVALSGDARLALSGSADHMIRLWEVSSGRCLRTFEGHTDTVNSVALSADGRRALSGSRDKSLRLWEVSSGKCLITLEGHTECVTSVALSEDGWYAVSVSSDNTFRIWAVDNWKCLRTIETARDGTASLVLSTDGRWILSGDYDSTLRVWEECSGKCLKGFKGHTKPVNSVALSLDGRWALSGSGDKTLRVWELDWDYEFPEQKDWDEGAKPYLERFLTLHCSVGEDGFTRVGQPAWTEEDFQKLLTDLQYCGYGWLRPEGVRRQLEKMTADW